jgi:multiple sugar transport system substrate-binding protein
MKRLLVLLIALVLSATLYIAAGSKKEEAPSVKEGKPFEDVELIAVTQPGPYIAGPLINHRSEWTEKSGGTVEVVEVPYENLYERMMTPLATKTHAYDILVFPATWLPDFAPYLVLLDDYIADSDTNPAWEDILPAFREEIASWGENVYALPLDGDTHTLFYRRHLFEDEENKKKFEQKYGYEMQVPETMQQLLDTAEFFTGWDWTGDGEPDYGYAQPMARGGQAHWWIWNYAAPYMVLPGEVDRYHGQLYFDPQTMEPLINTPGMLKGLELYKRLGEFGPPGMEAWGVGEIRSAYPSTANIAMTIEWGTMPGLFSDKSVAGPNVYGDCGSAPRPGAMQVWDRQNKQWVEMGKPNTAPVLCFGGWIGSITKTCENPDAAYDFLKFMNSPEISMQDVVVGDSGFNPYRYSHIQNIQAWVDAGIPEQDAEEFLDAVRADLENPNVQTDLKIPGKPEYVDDVLDIYVSSAIVGDLQPKEALDKIYEEWEEITDRLGREKQKDYYRKMMGMD